MVARLIPALVAAAAMASSGATEEPGRSAPSVSGSSCRKSSLPPEGRYILILRTVDEPFIFVPIAVGETEALALRLRIDGKPPPRPLTLNLLESVLSANKITVSRSPSTARSEGLSRAASSCVRRGRSWDLDARPSDAMALAAGKDIPIYGLARGARRRRHRLSELEARATTSSLEDTL